MSPSLISLSLFRVQSLRVNGCSAGHVAQCVWMFAQCMWLISASSFSVRVFAGGCSGRRESRMTHSTFTRIMSPSLISLSLCGWSVRVVSQCVSLLVAAPEVEKVEWPILLSRAFFHPLWFRCPYFECSHCIWMVAQWMLLLSAYECLLSAYGWSVRVVSQCVSLLVAAPEVEKVEWPILLSRAFFHPLWFRCPYFECSHCIWMVAQWMLLLSGCCCPVRMNVCSVHMNVCSVRVVAKCVQYLSACLCCWPHLWLIVKADWFNLFPQEVFDWCQRCLGYRRLITIITLNVQRSTVWGMNQCDVTCVSQWCSQVCC